ncbi:MAG TPA: winged helix-turn-helix domain-containing protein [Pyrinomonadaceae bacterium]|jgi:DNA-binding winged helix-turn-helix (wHTH) protein/TolB-like protein/Flp pilus assembly protein TadD
MSSEGQKLLYFDDISIDTQNFRVVKAGKDVTLTPRAFDVLVYLIQNAGRVVEKGELFSDIWKEAFVSDNALTKIIKEIRHALNDDANAPRYIETVPKRGYRFIGELKENSQQAPGETRRDLKASRFSVPTSTLLLMAGVIVLIAVAGWLFFRPNRAEVSPTTIQSIAVLPFKPLNTDSRDESLEMGMAETLIARLSNLKHVVVRPMSAVRKYTDLQQDPVKAGQEIQAQAVLDGSIQKVNDRIRITVRLIDVRDGRSLWSQQFDESFTDIFKVQDSIAERVTNALSLELSKSEQEQIAKHFTEDPSAYQLYLRGQLTWNGRRQHWITQSLNYYQQAVEKDPNFALAHIGVADAYIMLSGHRQIPMQDAEAKARPSIMKALEIDDSLAQAHNALAELKYQYEYDWSGAEREFKKAIALNSNVAWIRQAYGWFLMSEGRFDEARTEMDKARELDPSSLTINAGRARLDYYSRQYDQAIEQFQNIIAVEPNDASAYNALYAIYRQKQMYPEAVEIFLKCGRLINAPPQQIETLQEAFKTSGWTGFLRERLKYLDKSAASESVEPFSFADLYVALGEKEKAFEWLDKTFDAHDPVTLQFKIDPAYDNLRGDSRYAKLVQRIGLQP